MWLSARESPCDEQAEGQGGTRHRGGLRHRTRGCGAVRVRGREGGLRGPVACKCRRDGGEIERAGGRAVALSGDVSVAEDAAGMVDGAVDALGRLDIVVNSAGVTARNALPPGSDPDDVWDRVIEVNLRGTYLVSRCAVAHMQRGGGGSIVNLASTMGMVGYPPGLGGARSTPTRRPRAA